MDVSAIGLQGLQQAEAQLETAAARIAAPDGANPDVVDLSAEMVAMMSAQTLYEANLATLKTAAQTEEQLVNLTA